ncbi:hypothetical protein KUCAC02_003605, partial [Chaenocephalus aceratus]
MLGPAVAKPTPYVPLDNLNVIINKIGNSAKSSGKETWVENLTGLTEKCNDKFFCKSFAILKKPENHRQGEEVLLRNLKAYIVGTHANCTEKPERRNTIRNVMIRNLFPISGPKSSNVPGKLTCAQQLLPHPRPSRQWISRVP